MILAFRLAGSLNCARSLFPFASNSLAEGSTYVSGIRMVSRFLPKWTDLSKATHLYVLFPFFLYRLEYKAFAI